jgi:hypothetical protein
MAGFGMSGNFGGVAAASEFPLTFLALVKIDIETWRTGDGDGPLPILVDDVLWITGDDVETLKKYGFDPDAENDYVIVNETEKWVSYWVTDGTVFSVIDLELGSSVVSLQDFRDKLLNIFNEWDGSIWADVSIAETGEVIGVKERYVP